MSSGHVPPGPYEQPESFAFTPEYLARVEDVIAKYPEGRQASAVIALLDLAQRQNDGWIPQAAIEHVAQVLGMARIRVMEVATFYTMFNLEPIGRYHLQVCGTTPCWLRGSDDVFAAIKEELGLATGQSSPDGMFTVTEVECLGACVNAPMFQVNDDFYEDLTKESVKAILRALKTGEAPKMGPQNGRRSSEPEGARTTLLDRPKTNGAAQPAETPAAPPIAVEASDDDDDDDADAAPSLDDPSRPKALDAPEGGTADDLQQINGIGPKIEATLNELGIFHFRQIASWTAAEEDWIDGHLSFNGRIDREQWIEQAARLANERKASETGE
jgi:NADH-quinone oxidoreductase subunit E